MIYSLTCFFKVINLLKGWRIYLKGSFKECWSRTSRDDQDIQKLGFGVLVCTCMLCMTLCFVWSLKSVGMDLIPREKFLGSKYLSTTPHGKPKGPWGGPKSWSSCFQDSLRPVALEELLHVADLLNQCEKISFSSRRHRGPFYPKIIFQETSWKTSGTWTCFSIIIPKVFDLSKRIQLM